MTSSSSMSSKRPSYASFEEFSSLCNELYDQTSEPKKSRIEKELESKLSPSFINPAAIMRLNSSGKKIAAAPLALPAAASLTPAEARKKRPLDKAGNESANIPEKAAKKTDEASAPIIIPLQSKAAQPAESTETSNAVQPVEYTDDGIKKISLHTFLGDLRTMEGRSFSERLQKLKQYCTYVPNGLNNRECWKLRLVVDRKVLSSLTTPIEADFYILRDIYFSNAVHECKYVSKEETQEKNPYWYFKVVHNNDQEHPLVLIRSDLNGKQGEITNIYCADKLNGNFVKNSLCFPMLDHLRIQSVILNDDAKKVSTNFSKKDGMRLALLLPIVTKAGRPDEGSTWYSKHQIYPIKCKNLPFIDGKARATQDPSFYFAAVENIRHTPLSKMYNEVFKDSKEYQNNLLSLCNKYFPETVASHSSIEAGSLEKDSKPMTVSDLGQAIFAKAAEQSTNPSQAESANRDLNLFYTTCLGQRWLYTTSSKAARIYNLALDTMNSHYLWVKSYKPTEKGVSYAEFLKTPHQSFETLISKIKLLPSVNWNTLVDHYFKDVPDTKFVENESTIGVQEYDFEEFAQKMASIQANGNLKTPFQRMQALKEICTACSYAEDSSKVYWQAWVKIPRGVKKRPAFLELVIAPKSEKEYTFQLADFDTGATIMECTLGESASPGERQMMALSESQTKQMNSFVEQCKGFFG